MKIVSFCFFTDDNFSLRDREGQQNWERCIDYTNQILPQYSICMGITFDQLLKEHQ